MQNQQKLQDIAAPALIEPVETLNLTERTLNALKDTNVNYIAQLVQLNDKDLLRMNNLGKRSLNEIKEALKEKFNAGLLSETFDLTNHQNDPDLYKFSLLKMFPNDLQHKNILVNERSEINVEDVSFEVTPFENNDNQHLSAEIRSEWVKAVLPKEYYGTLNLHALTEITELLADSQTIKNAMKQAFNQHIVPVLEDQNINTLTPINQSPNDRLYRLKSLAVYEAFPSRLLTSLSEPNPNTLTEFKATIDLAINSALDETRSVIVNQAQQIIKTRLNL